VYYAKFSEKTQGFSAVKIKKYRQSAGIFDQLQPFYLFSHGVLGLCLKTPEKAVFHKTASSPFCFILFKKGK